ncbi:MAG: hypothetical protein WCT10_01420 [Patescibacteria group bacterium]|jgi:hypothetical protein
MSYRSLGVSAELIASEIGALSRNKEGSLCIDEKKLVDGLAHRIGYTDEEILRQYHQEKLNAIREGLNEALRLGHIERTADGKIRVVRR